METKHTPGEWHLDKLLPNLIKDENGNTIARCLPEKPDGTKDNSKDVLGRNEANAQRIIEAVELLNAVERGKYIHRIPGTSSPAIQVIGLLADYHASNAGHQDAWSFYGGFEKVRMVSLYHEKLKEATRDLLDELIKINNQLEKSLPAAGVRAYSLLKELDKEKLSITNNIQKATA